MKFRLAAAIALYFLLTLLFLTLSTTSSLENNENSQNVVSTQSNLLQNYSHNHATLDKKRKRTSSLLRNSRITQTSLLLQLKNNILSLVINEFLTCRDIIVLRQTCKDFQYLLHPNDVYMVTFYVYGISKTMATNIMWEDLKYFMKQNYYSAFDEMKMFNIKEDEYAVLTRVPEEKYIVWNNKSIPYYQMLLDEILYTTYTNPQNYYKEHFDPIKSFIKNGEWAIITKERNVKTGGFRQCGEDSSIVQSLLVNVKMIFSNNWSFSALLDNGSVVAWGNENDGGKIPDKIQTQLINVKKIFSTNCAFVALLNDATVVAWGNEHYGGKIPDEIQIQLVNVKMIFSTNHAFVALLDNGTAVAWGNKHGGNKRGGKIPRDIQKKMIKNVKMIFSTNYAFAALLNDGTVVAWGGRIGGGKIPFTIQIQLINVKMIFSVNAAFVALLDNGTAVAWGNKNDGGKITDEIQKELINVKTIFSTDYTFAALLDNGTIFAWGDERNGGKIPRDIQKQMIKNVKMIFSTSFAFAALLNDGTVVAWGEEDWGGKIPDEIQSQLIDVKQIIPKQTNFTALFENGKSLTWGKIF